MSKKHWFTTCTMMWIFVLLSNAAAWKSPDNGKKSREATVTESPFKRGFRGMRAVSLDDFNDNKTRNYGWNKLSGSKTQIGDSVVHRFNRQLTKIGAEVRITQIQEDNLGNRHIRMSQYLDQMPVVGSDMIVHVNKNNEIYLVTGNFFNSLTKKPSDMIDQESAIDIAKKAVSSDSVQIEGPASIVVFDSTVAYEIKVKTQYPQPEKWVMYIDARTGSLLGKQDRLFRGAPGSSGSHVPVTGNSISKEGGALVTIQGWHDSLGNYFLYHKNAKWGIYNLRNSDWDQRSTASWGTSDPAAVSLGKNFETIQNFVTTKLGRNSFNNLGGFAQANVHEGTNYVNAYWDGSDFHFGDGDNVEAGPLVTLDISAHEYGHGITQYTSNLDYSYESGALNESFSDIMGTWVEFWAQPDGKSAYPRSTPGYADWLCGEDAWLQGDALRDLRDPLRFSQPSYHMGTNWYTGSSDNGGVHTNSGVQNKVYYLLAEGGSGTNDGHPYNLTGMGFDTAGQIALYADMYLLTSTSQYRDSRNAWIQAAVTLGFNSNRVSDAWAAVGLLPLVKHLAVAPTSISFDSVGIGVADTMVISLANNGADATLISSLSFNNPAFSAAVTLPFSVPGGSTLPLRIVFTPQSYGPASGTLIITSNAADNPVITVPLSGDGVNPAVISITPRSFNQTVVVGDSTFANLIITNSGEATLNWVTAIIDNTIASAAAPPTYDISHFATLEKGAEDTRVGQPVSSFHGGPDRTGYTWIDSNEPNGPAYQWTDIKTNGTMLSSVSSCDDCFQSQKISFKFPFYNNSFDTIYVSSNGFITFGTGTSQISNYPLPSTSAPANLIDALHDDLLPSSGGDIYFKDYGDRAVIQFDNVYPYSGSGVYTFQIVLERSGAIYLYYNNLTGPLTGATVGIQNANRDDGLTVAYNTTYLQNSLAVKFTPKSKWLSATPLSGTVPAGQSASVRVAFNGAGISGGTYIGQLDITHNAPGTPSPQSVPCTLLVDGTRRLAATPATLNFGSHQAGIRDTSILTLTNNGDEATVVSSVSSTNPYFTCITSLPLTVTGYGNATIRVVYQPGIPGIHTGTLTVNSNAEDNPVISIPVTGTGLAAPQITILPASIAVSLNAGDSTVQIVKIRNPGGDSLSFSRTGVLPSWMNVSLVSSKIAAGDSAAFTVILRSSGRIAGTYIDSIQIVHNAPAQTNPQIVPVRMMVTSVKRLLTQPASISFGSVWVGRDSLTSLILQNTGNDTTTISSITSSIGVFTQTGIVPIKVPPFGTRTIQVRYSPVRTGTDDGIIAINSDAGNNASIAVNLTGTGVSGPQIVVSPNSLSRNLATGDSTSAIVTLTNNGGAALNWTIATIDNTNASIAAPPTYDASHFISLDKEAEDKRVGQTITSFHGGPDRTGYTWIDSNEPDGPAYQWTDIKATGTMLSSISSCDDCFQSQKISFKFPFYNNSFDTIYVSSNGFITFGTGSSQITNYPLPSTSAPSNLIDALHDDLLPSSGGDIYFKDYGDRAVIQFDNVYPYSGSGVYTFQIVLERSGAIELYYNNLTGPLTGATVGIQNANRDDGLTVVYNTTYLKNSLAVKFTPKSKWLSASPLSGTVPAGQSTSVRVTFNSTGISQGTYFGRFDFSHNAPGTPSPQSVPCTLLVNGPRHLAVTPATLNFGSHQVGIRDTSTLTLTNNGSEATVVSSVSSTNPYFTFITGLPLTVTGNGNATIRVVYQPGSLGNHSGTLTVNSNADDNPVISIPLAGNGTLPPSISVTPNQLSAILHPDQSTQQNLVIRNDGGDLLNYSIQLTGQSNWLALSTRNGSIQPGEQQTVTVTLNAMDLTKGTYNAVLSISHNDPAQSSPIQIPVTLQVSLGMKGEIHSIGVSATPVVSGEHFRIVNLKIGSPVTGKAQGSRYRLVIK